MNVSFHPQTDVLKVFSWIAESLIILNGKYFFVIKIGTPQCCLVLEIYS